MRMSHRAKRMDRNHARTKKTASFNLVSLMDIFTILVFFLLVNSSDVQELPNLKSIELPESISESKPREAVVVTVTDTDLLVQGNKVASIKSIMRAKDPTIEPLRRALMKEASRTLSRKRTPQEEGLNEVTVMGDKEIPFSLLKKVMATCTSAGYGKISLAVLQKAPQEG